jgi:hypothetical protein
MHHNKRVLKWKASQKSSSMAKKFLNLSYGFINPSMQPGGKQDIW